MLRRSEVVPAAPCIRRLTAADGYPLFARVWETPEPRARVVCLHGIISHGGWYRQSCRHLAAAGYEVHFLDRRGSGLNATNRGDVDCMQTWIDDVVNYLDSLQGSVPRILMGISWGGKLAAAVAGQRPYLLDGLALVCPGLASQTKAGRFQSMALGIANRPRLLRRTVPIPLQDPALFTNAYGWQEYIRSDPLTLRRITIRFARCDLQLNRYAAAAPPRIQTPTLVMLAGRDRIIDNPGVRDCFDRLATPDKQLIEYPESAHTLEFENDPQPFFRDLMGWLSARGWPVL